MRRNAANAKVPISSSSEELPESGTPVSSDTMISSAIIPPLRPMVIVSLTPDVKRRSSRIVNAGAKDENDQNKANFDKALELILAAENLKWETVLDYSKELWKSSFEKI